MTATIDLAEVRRAVGAVCDPEIPVLTIEDLGILRDLSVDGDVVTVTITPTYSGCPAMGQIAEDIERAAAPFGPVSVVTVYQPAWTTDWITDRGREALRNYGIAPPSMVGRPEPVVCPQCASSATRTVSEFGSTACKALHVCETCLEPFDLFKTL